MRGALTFLGYALTLAGGIVLSAYLIVEGFVWAVMGHAATHW